MWVTEHQSDIRLQKQKGLKGSIKLTAAAISSRKFTKYYRTGQMHMLFRNIVLISDQFKDPK